MVTRKTTKTSKLATKKAAPAVKKKATTRKVKTDVISLPYWKEWCDHLNAMHDSDKRKLKSLPSNLSRANARYRLAASFRGLDLKGYTALTRKGYESVLRMLLTFTAAEELGNAIGNRLVDWQIDNKLLAGKLRSLFVVETPSDAQADNGEIKYRQVMDNVRASKKNRLDQFQKKVSDDVILPATILRNLIAHGSLTFNFFYVSSKDGAKTLDELSAVLSKEVCQKFEVWLRTNAVIS